MMTQPFTFRAVGELANDSAGQLITEWTLLTATVVIPLGLLGTVIINVLEIYFYRNAGVIALPFP